jgi:predicted ArsR family transcriptional regulator
MAEVAISAAGMRVVKLLVGNRPQTVSELIRATGVTRTAVTEQLNELVEAGFAVRTVERLAGRGRPRHLYSSTHSALLLLFANNQHLVVPAIWQAIGEAGGEDLTRKILDRVSDLLAEHYCRKIIATDPQQRLEQFMRALEEEGGLVDIIHKDGKLTVAKRSCAFISMFDENRIVCAIELDMISRIVGAPVERVACRHDGAPCCTFEVVDPNSNGHDHALPRFISGSPA